MQFYQASLTKKWGAHIITYATLIIQEQERSVKVDTEVISVLVNLASLGRTEGTTHTLCFCKPCPPIIMGADQLTIKDALDVCLNITQIGDAFIVSGTIRASVSVACARCLESFVFPVCTDFTDKWVLAADAKAHSDDDIFPIDINREDIDVTDRMLEHFIVSLPMRYLCSDECKGLCPRCGHNLNTGSCDCPHQTVDFPMAILDQWVFETKE